MAIISKTIDDALIEIGVLSPIDEASPQDHSFALRKLNMIVDSYNTQNLMVAHICDVPFHIDGKAVQIQEPYIDIGIGKTWDTTAPIDVQGLYWRQNGYVDFKSNSMSIDQWNTIDVKNVRAIPKRHYVQKTENNTIKIFFDCIPIDGLELHLLAKIPYEGVNGKSKEYIPTDDISWDRGFEKMLTYRLAVELASSYEKTVSTQLLALANEAENNFKARNYTPRTQDGEYDSRHNRRNTRHNRARY